MPARRMVSDIDLELGPVRVFLDELEEIDRVIRQACEEVRLEVDNWELDSMGDLAEVPGTGRLREVSWSGHLWHGERRKLSSLSVALDPHLTIASSDPELRRYLEEVGDVLRPRRRRLAKALSWPWGVPLALVGLTIVSVLAGDDTANPEVPPAAFAIGLLLVAWTMFAFLWMPNHQALIFRSRRGDRASFWLSREVRLVLLGALAGAVFGTLGSYLLYLAVS